MNKVIDIIGGKCPCGRDIRYTTKCDKGSCNKYARCPTYKEMEVKCELMRLELNRYKQVKYAIREFLK